MSYLILLAGIALLLICGDLLVRGAVGLAERLGIPPMIIGLTIVAFGTSAPELVVSLKAALAGAPAIAIGNIVGSNIANIFLVMGVPALVMAIPCDQPGVKRNALYVLAISVIFTALCFMGPLSVWHGAILLVLMTLFLIESAMRANENRNGADQVTLEEIENIHDIPIVPHSMPVTVFFLLTGLIGLPAGGHLTVEAAKTIATDWGVTEAVIGLTVVAIGTSLPELATGVAAVFRRQSDIAIGNVLGSIVFNILAIAGLTAIIVPIPIDDNFLKFDLWVMLASLVAIMPFVILRRDLTRVPGAVFLLAYAAYVFVLVGPDKTAFAGFG